MSGPSRAESGWIALVGLVGATAALTALIYLWVVLGEQGRYADETGTSGDMSTVELATLLGALLSLPLFATLGVVGFGAWRSSWRTTRSDSE